MFNDVLILSCGSDSDHPGPLEGDDDQHNAPPQNEHKEVPLMEQRPPRVVRRSPRKHSSQMVVDQVQASVDLAQMPNSLGESRDSVHQQVEPGAQSHSSELPANSTIDAETHFKAIGELQKTKDELEKAINDRNEMQELLESRTSQLSVAQSFMSQTDSISVTDLTRMVESLNHDILQLAASFTDIRKIRRTRRQNYMTEDQIEDFQRNSQKMIGKYLTTALKESKPLLEPAEPEVEGLAPLEPDILIQISVQVCMVRCCRLIATTWAGIQGVGPNYDTMLSKIYTNLSHADPVVARRWRSMTRAQIGITAGARKHMMEFVHKELRNVLIVAGWSRDRWTRTPVSLRDSVSAIIDLTIRINIAIGQDIVSIDVQPIEILPETRFDSAKMDDTFADSRRPVDTNTSSGRVVAGTTALGLQMVAGVTTKMGSRIFLKPEVFLKSVSQKMKH
ncbi:hypothetical protein BDZ94DRAFT_1234859 [Collybia nuda]|uniref:Uncharacterized protein n=1 Tax=Collybia nuda TaxID=64659 RepID=A0A9P6CLY9_9AGAR|nr:hypothetical protein BDZ94DRAFT_1234859 [Collybia nuda]